MPPKRIEFTVPEEFLKRIDKARGYEPRASFVKRALESAIETGLPLPPEVLEDVRRALESPRPLRVEGAPTRHGRRAKSHQDLAMERQRKLNEKRT